MKIFWEKEEEKNPISLTNKKSNVVPQLLRNSKRKRILVTESKKSRGKEYLLQDPILSLNKELGFESSLVSTPNSIGILAYDN